MDPWTLHAYLTGPTGSVTRCDPHGRSKFLAPADQAGSGSLGREGLSAAGRHNETLSSNSNWAMQFSTRCLYRGWASAHMRRARQALCGRMISFVLLQLRATSNHSTTALLCTGAAGCPWRNAKAGQGRHTSVQAGHPAQVGVPAAAAVAVLLTQLLTFHVVSRRTLQW